MPLKFLGHPLHPIVVHFPIAFFTVYGFLLLIEDATRNGLVRAWKGQPNLDESARLLLNLGLLSLILVIPAGINDNEGVATIFTDQAVFLHALSGTIVTLLFLVHYILRVRLKERAWEPPVKIFYLGTAWLGALLTGLTGFLGGNLVYK